MPHRRMTDENAREALPDCTLSGPAWLANDDEVSFDGQIHDRGNGISGVS
jgi:hypothetical protein